MYYSAGTYESFAHPEKPEGVDKKSAYIIGTGLAGLTAAFYLVRDGQMKGEHIHLLEKLELAGGSCDGRKDVTKGFFMRGGREMDNHFEVMWDTFRDVPSIETPGVSVLDEYYWLNKHDPNYSLCRATVKCGEDAHTDRKFELDKESALALSKLFLTPEKDLEDKKISDVLPESFWNTNFWLYWQTMFAFQRWSSALEMKRYLCRYVHHIDGLPDFSALRFTKYNQYESMILPLVKYLESHGVRIEYGMDVKNVIIETEGDKKVAKQIVYVKDGEEQTIDLIEDDLVFITNGCCTDTSCYGDQNHAPDLSGVKNGYGESWDMWKAIAAQAKNGEFGNPDKFCCGCERDQLDERYGGNLQRGDHSVYHEDLQEGSSFRQGNDRRYRHCQGQHGQLVSLLDDQPSAAVQVSGQEYGTCMAVFPQYQQGRQLCEESHAGLHRRRGLP